MSFIKREDFNIFCEVLDLKPKFLDKLGVMHEESDYLEWVQVGRLWARTSKIQEVARIENMSARSLYDKSNGITLANSLFSGIPNEEIIIKLDHITTHRDFNAVYPTLGSMLIRTFGETVDLLIPVIAYGILQAILVKGALFMGFSDFVLGKKEEPISFYTEYRVQSTGKVTVENYTDNDVESMFNSMYA